MALRSKGKYACGGNALWSNPLYNIDDDVPMEPTSINMIQDFFFKTPEPIGLEFGVHRSVPDKKGAGQGQSAQEMLEFFKDKLKALKDKKKKKGEDDDEQKSEGDNEKEDSDEDDDEWVNNFEDGSNAIDLG